MFSQCYHRPLYCSIQPLLTVYLNSMAMALSWVCCEHSYLLTLNIGRHDLILLIVFFTNRHVVVRLIRAKYVEPELLKNINTIQKYSDADQTVCHVKKYLCANQTICDIPKYHMLIQTGGQNQTNIDLLNHPCRFLSSPSFSPSLPIPQYLILSFYPLCLIPRHNLPVFISHKKRMIHMYDHH